METLMMPGKVIEGHAKYEEKCNSCHQPFSKEKQSTLCRDCHKEVDADIKSTQGLHGHMDATETECSHCHTDHQGRDADVIQLDKETFDDSKTDFSLKGAHTIVRCKACHSRKKKYRDTATACVSCHENDDIHKGVLGETCSDCHSERAWRHPDFDHDSTDFALREKHAELECNSCHVDQAYKDTTQQCHGCHLLNDVHAGRYGEQCGDCHSEKDWGQTHFDHSRDTSYPLRGKHRSTKCDVCHNGNVYKEKLDKKCISCHRNDDQHSGRYGKQCKSCHTPENWKRRNLTTLEKPIFHCEASMMRSVALHATGAMPITKSSTPVATAVMPLTMFTRTRKGNSASNVMTSRTGEGKYASIMTWQVFR